MKNYKTTLSAIMFAVVEGIQSVPDFSALTTQELLMRAVKLAAIAAIGIFAADGKRDAS